MFFNVVVVVVWGDANKPYSILMNWLGRMCLKPEGGERGGNRERERERERERGGGAANQQIGMVDTASEADWCKNAERDVMSEEAASLWIDGFEQRSRLF